MSLNHILGSPAFSGPTSLGGRLESPSVGHLSLLGGLNNTVPAANIAANYTVQTTDYFIPVDTTAARTITLPAAAVQGLPLSNGFTCMVQDATGGAGANAITIAPGAGTTIQVVPGGATIAANYGSHRYIYWNTIYYTF